MKIHQYSVVCIVLTLPHVVLMFRGLTEAQDDPCDIAQALPNNYIGSRNEHCNEWDVRTNVITRLKEAQY